MTSKQQPKDHMFTDGSYLKTLFGLANDITQEIDTLPDVQEDRKLVRFLRSIVKRLNISLHSFIVEHRIVIISKNKEYKTKIESSSIKNDDLLLNRPSYDEQFEKQVEQKKKGNSNSKDDIEHNYTFELVELNKPNADKVCCIKLQLNIPGIERSQLLIITQWETKPTPATQLLLGAPLSLAVTTVLNQLKSRRDELQLKRSLLPLYVNTQLENIHIKGVNSLQENTFKELKNKNSGLQIKPITLLVGKNGSGKSTILKTLNLLKNTQKLIGHNGILATNSTNADLKINANEAAPFEITLKYVNHIAESLKNNKSPSSRNSKIVKVNCSLTISFIRSNSESDLHQLKIVNLTLHAGREHKITCEPHQDDIYEVACDNPKLKEKIQLTVGRNLFEIFEQIRTQLKLPYYFPDFLTSQHVLNAYTSSPRRVYQLNHGYLTADAQNMADEIVRNSALESYIGDWLVKFGFAKECMQENNPIAFRCITSDKISNAAKLEVYNGHKWIDLFDAGAGISHIIPIIIRGFIGNDTDTIIIENPEHHLHHEAQAKLAHLLLNLSDLSNFQKRFIIETQSTYLVKEFQYLMVKEKIDYLKSSGKNSLKVINNMKGYYFAIEKQSSENDRISVIREINLMSEKDTITPIEYFDFDYQQNIGIANAQVKLEELKELTNQEK